MPGGSISMEPREDGGSRFVVTVPLVLTEELLPEGSRR